ncbi:SUR7/PalI family-domain-containing protein, partial [Mycena capillaripes]
MGCIRPATPGFILTTLATALLAVVSFCVPYFKSVFFLKADLSTGGSITFGTLGYCLELNGVTTCSKPTVGYELDINSLVGNKLPVEIPNVVVKWLTYVLVLHIVALALAAGSAVFGLLAHVREMSMACCSTCVSGFAAAVALLAFIFDLALFFIAKARINAVGTASIGNAIWLTLAAWVLLFFSGCFYTLGRCCISKRKRGDWDRRQEPPPHDATEQLRLDAVKAEADRKARQKASEGGLPAFHESQPLTTTAYDDGNNVYTDKPMTPGGYMQAPPGSRAVDQYYN